MATALLTQTTLLAVIIISCCDVIMCQNDAHCNDAGQPVKCYFSECIHGICVNVTYEFGGRTLSLEECKCDTGWTGFYCDTCCKCDPDEICVFQNFPFPPKCIRNDTSNETTTTLTYTDEVRDQSPVETTTSQTTTTLPYTDEIRNQSTIETTTSQTTTTLPYTDEIRDQSAIETTTSQTTTTLPYTDEIRDQSAIETTTSQTTTTLTYTDEIRDQSTIETTTSQGRYPARNSTTLTYTDEVRDQSPIETTTSQCRYPARNSTPCYIKHADSRCVNGICEETYCNCDQGWGGFECEVCCDLPCVHGLCDATIVGDPKCACETAYQGDLCDEIKPKEIVPIGIWVWCLVGVACAALLASVIVIAVLWKQRNINVLKIVCKIQMMKYDRNFEKDKKYDVCISCAGSDERFVETWILPHLERELGYKVWMKARDTMPGDVISSSVIASVKQSRRTLMVISPDYLTEEWPLFEVQQALVETLQQNHAIIPIIISDMSHVDYIQPLIRSIMQTWRCVKWPADVESEKKIKRFWKRVEVSMPDRPTTKDDEVDTEEFVDSEVKKQFACDDIKGHDNFVFIHDQDALYMNAEDSKTSL